MSQRTAERRRNVRTGHTRSCCYWGRVLINGSRGTDQTTDATAATMCAPTEIDFLSSSSSSVAVDAVRAWRTCVRRAVKNKFTFIFNTNKKKILLLKNDNYAHTHTHTCNTPLLLYLSGAQFRGRAVWWQGESDLIVTTWRLVKLTFFNMEKKKTVQRDKCSGHIIR